MSRIFTALLALVVLLDQVCRTHSFTFSISPLQNRPQTRLCFDGGDSADRRKLGEFKKFKGDEVIPEEQLPILEYQNLLDEPFFDWATEGGGLVTKLSVLYGVLFAAVCYPISCQTWTMDGYILQRLTASNIGALGTVLVFLVRLFSGWSYIGSRLKSDFVIYEETGWYDGAVEKKSKEAKMRDTLVYNDDVRPVVDRLKTICLALAATWALSAGLFANVASMKPIFNEYDPNFINQLNANDDLAEIAAKKANGRPTYCDSRYYKAVAGGGQGC
ncbi:hypothetical protein TrCOL_g12082 [Triparma columacea]|uniref:Uncharacterized protein n=1 Tax=Triparma columacea TaxID=722753 RepID=A0A9W7GLX7_9STRA|nr:hypothetical protein TrCOL_g12082 [Triparma columacea]